MTERFVTHLDGGGHTVIERFVVDLDGGGSVTVTLEDVHLAALDDEDRRFLFWLIDHVRARVECAQPAPAS